MREQVVGLFKEAGSAVEAARLIRAAGYGVRDVDMVSRDVSAEPCLEAEERCLGPGRLMERPDGTWPCALRWALVGSCIVEVPVLIWVLLAFDSWGIQVLLAVSLWKFGTLFEGLLGAIVGSDQGLESDVARAYESHLVHGNLVLAARVAHADAPQARGVMIESGAYDVRNVSGRFIVTKGPVEDRATPALADSRPVH